MSKPEPVQRLPLPKGMLRDLLLAIPLMLLVLVGYYSLFALFGATPHWAMIGLGALGWLVALNLRAPFVPIAKRLGQERGGRFMAVMAGPCEELVRLAVVLIFGRSFPVALSLGFGWGGVEVLFTLVNHVMRMVLMTRDDEKARQAREILAAQGPAKIPAGWLVGAWERLFATGIHVGFTLLVAYQPWLVVALLPVHSLVDLTIPVFAKRSVWIVEGLVTVVGGAALYLGLHVFGQV